MDQELYQLIHQAKKGNKQAFSNLMTKYKGSVFRQAYATLGDRMEAEDVVQEAFLKVYYSLSRLESEYAFTSWLSRIVSNLCYDKLQKKKNIISIDYIEEQVSEKTIEQKQVQMNVHEAMQKLSSEHREVIVLRELQGFSYEEISKILGIPLGTVRSRIFHARMLLKEELIK